MSSTRGFSYSEWDDRHDLVLDFFSRENTTLTFLLLIVAAFPGYALFLLLGVLVPPFFQLVIYPVLYGFLVFFLRQFLISSGARRFRVKLATFSFWAGRRAHRLPAWTLGSGIFPQAQRYVRSQELSLSEVECLEVLVDEFDGSLGELVTLSRSLIVH